MMSKLDYHSFYSFRCDVHELNFGHKIWLRIVWNIPLVICAVHWSQNNSLPSCNAKSTSCNETINKSGFALRNKIFPILDGAFTSATLYVSPFMSRFISKIDLCYIKKEFEGKWDQISETTGFCTRPFVLRCGAVLWIALWPPRSILLDDSANRICRRDRRANNYTASNRWPTGEIFFSVVFEI